MQSVKLPIVVILLGWCLSSCGYMTIVPLNISSKKDLTHLSRCPIVFCQRELLAQDLSVVLPNLDNGPAELDEWLRRMRKFHDTLNEITGFNLNHILLEDKDAFFMELTPGMLIPGIETV